MMKKYKKQRGNTKNSRKYQKLGEDIPKIGYKKYEDISKITRKC